MDNSQPFAYRSATIDFVTAAAQTCLLLEHVREMEPNQFIAQSLQMLPVLYLRTRLLDEEERLLDGELQHWVQEEDYNYVQQGVAALLGTNDTYLSVLTPDARYTDEPCTCRISEDLADIYQELKDMAANFQLEQEEIMQEAVLGCAEAFREHWGQKLLNALSALHALHTEDEPFD